MLNEDETLPEGSTMTPSQVRKLKIAIAIMSVLLVAGFILLLVGIYLQTQKLATKPASTPPRDAPSGIYGTIDIPVRAGSQVMEVLVSEGQLILHLRQPGGDEIAIIDLATGREVQRFMVKPQKSP